VALQTEWFLRRRQVPDALLADVDGYAQVFWRFDKEWGVAGRYEYGSPVYDGGDRAADDLDPDWIDHRHRISASVSFWPTEFSRIRLQGSADLPGWLDDPIYAAMLAMEFNIGAHGAHKF
jgi:hypothetical protein